MQATANQDKEITWHADASRMRQSQIAVALLARDAASSRACNLDRRVVCNLARNVAADSMHEKESQVMTQGTRETR